MRPAAHLWLRAEGAVLLLLGLLAVWQLGLPFWLAALLFFAPDIGFAGYALGPRIGGLVYNLLHTTVLPLLGAVGIWLAGADPQLLALMALWLAHIGFDRLLGYGLKGADFQTTHLGPIGRRS